MGKTPFKMNYKNSSFPFKSSPAKTGDHSTPDPVDGHQHLTDKQKLAAANRRKDESISRIMSKHNVSKKTATKTYNERSGHRTKVIKET